MTVQQLQEIVGKKGDLDDTFSSALTFAQESRPHDEGLSENKGILSIICFWSSWPPKKKGLSLKTVSLLNLGSSSLSSSTEDLGPVAQPCPTPFSISAVFWSEIHSISIDIPIIFYFSYSSTSPLIIFPVIVLSYFFLSKFFIQLIFYQPFARHIFITSAFYVRQFMPCLLQDNSQQNIITHCQSSHFSTSNF